MRNAIASAGVIRKVMAMVACCLGVTACADGLPAQTAADPDAAAARTRVVILGSGNPYPDPDRSGPAVVIVVDSSAYLFDAGVGVVRQWSAALQNGISSLDVTDLRIAFITHLHSDHTLGYPDLILTSWTIDRGRPRPFDIYGPGGLQKMTDHLLAAYADDIAVRTGPGGELQGATPPIVRVHEVVAGEVYKDALISVTAFPVPHGTWRQAFGYRIQTPDKKIVISGDTGPAPIIAEQCQGCDILLHEGGVPNALVADYYRRFHTTGEELAKIATAARPKLLVLYHQRVRDSRSDSVYRTFRSLYSGPFVVADDLTVIY